MPPHVTRKRLREEDDESIIKAARPGRRKATLYDGLDAVSIPNISPPLQTLFNKSGKDQDDESDMSSSGSEEEGDFEDVPLAKRRKVELSANSESGDDNDDGASSSGEDDMVFEDVPVPMPDFDCAPAPTGDLELTLRKDTRISMTNSQKKGPTKRARQARILTHCMHVQFLLWHNTVRNAWICDLEVQAIMISHIPPRLWDDIDRWRLASGLDTKEPERLSRKNTKAKGKPTTAAAAALEETVAADPSRDPLYRLMDTLVGWWKQRFQVTQPGLRKRGYMELERLDSLDKDWAKDPYNSKKFGERIENIEEFRICAQTLKGSRDVGAQLFTALIRGLGMEARLVANLQPLGFGWNRLEEAEPEAEPKTPNELNLEEMALRPRPGAKKPKLRSKPKGTNNTTKKTTTSTAGKRNPSRRAKSLRTIANSEDDSEDQDGHEENDLTMEFDDSDEDSVANVDLSVSQTPHSSQKHDVDLEFPIYWTEVLSPITNRYIPVDATVKKAIGSTRELIELLEPRGGKADKARQIMAYVIGHSADGTAKDVTVRYLRKQMFPGRTKGYRLGIEKIAVRNRHGKVKRYDYFDWFGKVIACFARRDGSKKYPITNAELQEDSTDLQPAKPEKKEVKEGEETLQYFKTSLEFVLVRHLKREEALLPDAEIVRYFKTKVKGKVNEEPIYRRSDVVNVKSAETWHKQGRAPKSGEIPLKRVPYRAATNNRRRELAEAEAATGQKALQGLYSMEQTDWIIPDPIQNGVIPKNNYGNIDLFAAHMCPQGAVHVPYRGAMRACKKLGYDYAEAVVDFEFGHRMAVPVIQGVVCAEEYYDAVMEQVRIDEAERQRKEDEKRRKNSLAMWRKLLKGLRIIERVRADYGEVMEGFQVFGRNHQRPEDLQREKEEKAGALADMGGGFIPEGYEEDIEHQEDGADQRKAPLQTSSFFPVVDDDDDDDDGGLVVEDTRVHEPLVLPQTSPNDKRNEGILDSDDGALSEPGSDAKVEPKSVPKARANSRATPRPKPEPASRRVTRRSARKRVA
ncbi:hypothetical protein Cpir12675_000663 [Ceratocystis pirilliformis]|uniref:DNA repair protein rhp42 n=1 Tax=Ceratocystis pirilliformis TaxID=259994 RepID=A0ABR3ZKB4_9PEZI